MLLTLIALAHVAGLLWLAIAASRWRSSRIKYTGPVWDCLRPQLGKNPTPEAKARYIKWLAAQSREQGGPN
jgi:hypothetical protein